MVAVTMQYKVEADNEEDAIDACLALDDGVTQPESGARVLFYKFQFADALKLKEQ
jgi:hypothetical protein